MKFSYSAIILSIFCLSAWATIPSGPVVDLGYVSLVGNATTPTGSSDGPVHFFGGIPYAQPPLGLLRFRAPQLLDEHMPRERSDVPIRDARNWGPACIQQPAVVGVGSEGKFLFTALVRCINLEVDCLLLNVWKPSGAKPGDKLPVIVYIYVRSALLEVSFTYLGFDRVADSTME